MIKIIIYIIFFSIANQFVLGEPLKFTNIEKTYLGKNQTLSSMINKGLNAVSNQEIMNLQNRCLGGKEISKNSHTIKLSKQEQIFIKNHTSITLGTDRTWEPWVIIDHDNKISGYDTDILSRINELTGANFQLKAGVWLDMVKLAETGKIDGLSTGAVHDERKKYLNFSDTYLSLKKLILVSKLRKDEIQSEKDLAGKTIIFHKGNLADEKIAKKYTNSKIIWHPSY